MQVIAPELSLSLNVTDLRASAVGIREANALDQIWQKIQQPFNLKKGALFRVHLWQLQDNEHLLLMVLHHIIFDEWSSGILIRELGELYTALIEARPAVLPELPIQYADFAHWQQEWMRGEVLNAQLTYWKQQLKGVQTLCLSRTVFASKEQGHQGASQLLELPQQLLDGLEQLSQQAGTTLFMTLLAVFKTLLHRYSGQTDIVIGSPIANRHRSELEGLIGFLVNSLVLRTNLAGDPTFRDLLHRVRAVTLAAYAHQDLPFEKLVEVLQPVRSIDQNPLFQVVFALQNAPMEQLALPGLVFSPVDLETKTARFDLEFYVWKSANDFRSLWGKGWQQSDGLRGVLVYKTDLFDSSKITALRHHFQTLLEEIVANPDLPLSQLSLLTPTEKQSLFQLWHSNQSSYPSNDLIHQRFEAQVRERPNEIALKFKDQLFTYEMVNQGSNQLARYLRRIGVGIGNPVAICMTQGVAAVAAMLAVLKVGGAYVPLDLSYPPERLKFIIEDAGVSVVLTQADMSEMLQTSRNRVICLDQDWELVAQEFDQNLSVPGTANQLAYIIYTSGSTGIPKGVMVPHRAVNRLVLETNYIQIAPGDRIAQVANLAFDAATFEVWGALLNGAQLIGISRETALSPIDFVAELLQQQINILFLTTALLNQTVNQIPTAFSSLKYLLFGGEQPNVHCVRLIIQQGKPQHLIHVYGPTENTTFTSWYEVHNISENAMTIPIGQAISNTQIYVLDAAFQPVPAGINGEIYLGGDGLAQGYLNRPALTAESFIDFPIEKNGLNRKQPLSLSSNHQIPNTIRLYKTGDRALYHPDGNLKFLGRKDHQIKIRGFRVELGEIEAVLTQHPTVQTVVVVYEASNSPSPQEGLIAYVVSQESAVSTVRELRSFLKTKLPTYMLPTAFVVLDKLPLTANGKVDRSALPPPDSTSLDRTPLCIGPKTSLEVSLLNVWTQLLGEKPIGIHDSFFELGGHSLLATQLVSRIRDHFQVELSLRTIFETPTIAELAQEIEAQQIKALGGFQPIHKNRFTDSVQNREEVEL